MSKMICPQNPNHKEFITTAHEMHEWVVDENGNFVEDLGCIEVTAEADPGNIWSCKECFSEAIMSE